VQVVTEQAREVVAKAFDAGWAGPPFDPIALADLLDIEVVARDDVHDARTAPVGRSKARIEFNPNRPRGRMRFSLAHELAHTLFPDCLERVRYRVSRGEMRADEWQLEALCNIAAAEFLMPLSSLPALASNELSMYRLLDLHRAFDVSVEALLIRIAETSNAACAAFAAALPGLTPAMAPSDGVPARTAAARLDYLIPSLAWRESKPGRVSIPSETRSMAQLREEIGAGMLNQNRRWVDWESAARSPRRGLFGPGCAPRRPGSAGGP
jgi:hypothetical protein